MKIIYFIITLNNDKYLTNRGKKYEYLLYKYYHK